MHLFVPVLNEQLITEPTHSKMGVEEEQVRLLNDPEQVLRTKWNSQRRPLCALSITILSLLANVALLVALVILITQDHQCRDPSLQLVFCK